MEKTNKGTGFVVGVVWEGDKIMYFFIIYSQHKVLGRNLLLLLKLLSVYDQFLSV